PSAALTSYTRQLATQQVAQATGLPPDLISQMMAQANPPKPHFYDSPVFNAVLTVVAVVAAPFTGGASLLVLGAVQAALAVVRASDSGNMTSLSSAAANIAGAAVNGVVSAATGGLVEADISYSEENGFGAQVGV